MFKIAVGALSVMIIIFMISIGQNMRESNRDLRDSRELGVSVEDFAGVRQVLINHGLPSEAARSGARHYMRDSAERARTARTH